jgi:hypothetical protein
MARRPAIATQAEIGRDTPLRLDVAASLAFPAGGMTAAGLRREAKRGLLVIWRMAGKDWTSLAEIERMIPRCLVPQKAPTYTSDIVPDASRNGPSETEAMKSARAALNATVQALKKPSPLTSPKNTGPTSAAVIRGEFPSPTYSTSTPRNGSR